MRRTDPPPLAIWMLEHSIPGEQDEALTGDLVEGFRAGHEVRVEQTGVRGYRTNRDAAMTFIGISVRHGDVVAHVDGNVCVRP